MATRGRKKSNNSVIISLIISIIILIIGIYAIKNIPDINNNNNNTNISGNISNNWDNYYIWDTIIKQWEISSSQSIWLYTHILTTTEWNKIWLKSKNVDLTEFEWNIQIKWTITDIKNDIPIVEVDEIMNIEDENINTELTWQELTWEELTPDTDFYFSEYGIYMDFQSNTWYTVQMDWNTINIISIDEAGSWETLLSISPFVCDETNNLQNCSSLQAKFESYKFENFTSTQWIKFYKIVETSRWTFFNDNLWGYNVVPKSDRSLISLSKYIYLFSKDDIKEKISSNIKNICKNDESSLITIDEFETFLENGNMAWNIVWKDENWNTLSCDIEIKPWKTIYINLIWIQNLWKDTSYEDTQTYNASSVVNLESQTNDSWETDPALANKMKFESTRWFVMYMPNHLAFEGIVLDPATDLSLGWLKCDYKINMIDYKNKDQLSTNPSVEVYLCSTQLDEDSIYKLLTMKKIKYVKATNSDLKFFIKYSGDSWKAILDQLIIN